LRHCATSHKVEGSIPDGVIVLNTTGHTMALGSTQPLTEMGTRNICWGKGGRCVELTTVPLSCTGYLAILGTTTAWSPNGLLGRYRDIFTFTFTNKKQLNC